MTFSYTQVSQYLRCPRSYRFRYLDGWREKESRAALCFGRCFLNLGGFAPASEWDELPIPAATSQAAAHDV